ncbi:MAG TPA: YbdD/YjiX family protein [Gemmatimonadaceae bacterium]|jgi:uncharacterized short protein YbdD (DUF466 family)
MTERADPMHRDAAPALGVARRVAAVIRKIIGVPDYEAYVTHVRTQHPGQEPLSERDFHRERLTARYSQPGNRCC